MQAHASLLRLAGHKYWGHSQEEQYCLAGNGKSRLPPLHVANITRQIAAGAVDRLSVKRTLTASSRLSGASFRLHRRSVTIPETITPITLTF